VEAEFTYALSAKSVSWIRALHFYLFGRTLGSNNQPPLIDWFSELLSSCLLFITSLRILAVNWYFWRLANSTDIISALAPTTLISEIRFELPSDLVAFPEIVHGISPTLRNLEGTGNAWDANSQVIGRFKSQSG